MIIEVRCSKIQVLRVVDKPIGERLEVKTAKRYQANGSHCEDMAVLTCPKSIPKGNLVPRPKYNYCGISNNSNNNMSLLRLSLGPHCGRGPGPERSWPMP
ncbi:hypothetical protein TNCV_4819911 [Trichonephila clavipes]|nr:hypothetical protein TNCV_4819911 [Trichonephila clavipes]